jgi:hypothetical protein
MQLNRLRFFVREKRLSLWLGAAALSFGIFGKITSELLENEVRGLDSSILATVSQIRRPWLTGIAVDITALGSITLVALISANLEWVRISELGYLKVESVDLLAAGVTYEQR